MNMFWFYCFRCKMDLPNGIIKISLALVTLIAIDGTQSRPEQKIFKRTVSGTIASEKLSLHTAIHTH